jgi:DNA-directed RNA polymerase specialized sigma24 family protein
VADFSPEPKSDVESGGRGGGRKGKSTRIGTGDDDYSNFNKILAAISRLEKRTGRTPTALELAEETGLSVSQILSILKRFLPDICLEDAVRAKKILQLMQVNDFSTVEGVSSKYKNELVYSFTDRFYCVAFIGTLNSEDSEDLTALAMRKVLGESASSGHVRWTWREVSRFIVDEIAAWHIENSHHMGGIPEPPSAESISNIDLETTVILGTQRVKRCISALPEEQKKVFILRHQLDLEVKEVAIVLNADENSVMAWLRRARVQLVKCLGRG